MHLAILYFLAINVILKPFFFIICFLSSLENILSGKVEENGRRQRKTGTTDHRDRREGSHEA